MAIYTEFASILEYPESDISPLIAGMLPVLEPECPKAVSLLRLFQREVAGKNLGELQELYTATFDMRPDCAPSIGYQLFGDEARRSFFLIRLKDRLEAHGVDPGCELPDHLPVVLRLLEKQGEGEEGAVLINDGLIPSLTKMAAAMEQTGEKSIGSGEAQEAGNPYRRVVEALLAYMQRNAE